MCYIIKQLIWYFMTPASRILTVLLVLLIGGYAVLLLPNFQQKGNNALPQECLVNVPEPTKIKA